MIRAFRTLAAAGAMALVLTPAWGQACLPAEEGDRQLEAQFGERPLFEGVTAQGDELRLFLNPKTGSWTLVIYPEPGVGCGVMSGEGGQPAGPINHPKPKGKGV